MNGTRRKVSKGPFNNSFTLCRTNYVVAGGAATQILFQLLQSVFQTFEHLTIVP